MSGLRIETIQNGVDTELFSAQDKGLSKQKLGLAINARTIAFAVAANPEDTRKGIDVILKAIEKLKTPVTFLPMSIGAGLDQLQAAVSKNSRILPPQHLSTPESLRDYYSAADLIWHPSRADTSSLVSMEAMACGTPVIASEVGGVPEVVGRFENDEDRCCILIPPESPSCLANETDKLFGRPDVLEKMATLSRQRAVKYFDIQRMVDDHLDLYQTSIVSND